MRIQRFTQNAKNKMSWMEVVLNMIEMVLCAATLIFTTAFGLCTSLYISTTEDKKIGKGFFALMSKKAIDYLIKGPVFGSICIITFPSSLLAFLFWIAMCKCKY